MVVDGQVLVAELPGGFRHALDRVVTVRGSGVAMKITANVVEFDQSRQLALAGGLDLAPVLAQLGRNEWKSQLTENLALGPPGDALLAAKETVLVQLQFPACSEFPHGDVVRLRSGEVIQRGTVTHLRNHPEIHLQTVTQPHGGARSAL